jgi:hypothetical protein
VKLGSGVGIGARAGATAEVKAEVEVEAGTSSEASLTVELVCTLVVAGANVLEVVAGTIGVGGSAGAAGGSVAAAELSSWEGAASFDNLAWVFGCAAVGMGSDFGSLTSGKLRRSKVLRKITGVGRAVVVPDVVPDGIPEDCGVGSVAVVESKVAESPGEVAVSGCKVMDVANGSSRRGASIGGVTACGTNGLTAGLPAELTGSEDDVVSASFCFFCGTVRSTSASASTSVALSRDK